MPEEDISKGTQGDVKSRVGTSVPHPDNIEKLSEQEKRALELQGEIEHAMGERREEIAERAEKEVKPRPEQ